MKAKSVFAPLCGIAVLIGAAHAADKAQSGKTQPKSPSAPTKPAASQRAAKPADDRAADEKALRKSAEDFARAFNARDAKAIAAQFAPQAEMVDFDGKAIQGRAAIEESFARQFAEPLFKIAVEIESLRFVGENLAVEDGHLVITDEESDITFRSRYTAVHVRDGGKWLVASSRDVVNPNDRIEPHEHLRQLSWLVGDWVQESGNSLVATSYRWDEGKNFLLGDYTVKVAGQATMKGTQRIGWDPLTKQIKTWTFDSDGGYGEGYWHRDGDRWLLKLEGVSADGRSGSMTQIHAHLNDHRRTWRAVDRVLGGEPLNDIDEITVVRAAPKPTKPSDKKRD